MYSQPIDQPFFCKESKTGLCVLCEGCVTNDPGSLQYRDPNCTMVVNSADVNSPVNSQPLNLPNNYKCACE
jgi:hypothetical protein